MTTTLEKLRALSERATAAYVLFAETGLDFSIVAENGVVVFGEGDFRQTSALLRSLCDPKVQEAMARAHYAASHSKGAEWWDSQQLPVVPWKKRHIDRMRAAIQALITGAENV